MSVVFPLSFALSFCNNVLFLLLTLALASCSLSVSSPAPHTDDKNFITLHAVGSSSALFLPQSVLQRCTKKRVKLSINFFNGKLMYTVGQQGLNLVDVRKLQKPVLPGDALFFLFGYIDCEMFIAKRSKDRGFERVVRELVESYEKVVLLNAAFVPGVTILISGMRPPYDLPHVIEEVRGTIKERILGTVLLNYHLRKMCARNNFKFIEFFEDYAVDNGSFNLKISSDTIHIRDYHENTKMLVAKALGAY